jgi:hypothetical protein
VSVVVYGVIKNDDVWSIDHQGHKVGRWPSRAEAEAEATRLAREADRLGHEARTAVVIGERRSIRRVS